jgi:translation elongation factor EF-Ts
MNPKEKAKELVMQFYFFLHQVDSDVSEEILITTLSIKCSINSCCITINELARFKVSTGYIKKRIDFYKEVIQELKKM